MFVPHNSRKDAVARFTAKGLRSEGQRSSEAAQWVIPAPWGTRGARPSFHAAPEASTQ